MAKQFSSLAEIDESRTDWHILLRINRKWRNCKGWGDPEDADLHCVGIDRDGMQIHIEIDREFVNTYNGVLQEGGVYMISHFYVNQITTYEPVTRSNKIEFMMGTTAVEYGGPQVAIPEHNFDFIDFEDVPNYLGDRQFLLDVIGCIHGITDEESSHTRFGNAAITNFVLLNNDLQKLNVTLWGSCSTNFNNLRLRGSNQPVVLIVTSLIVKKIAGIYRVSSANATKTYANINHEVVRNFINSFPGEFQPPLVLPPENATNQWRAQQDMAAPMTVTQLLALPRNNVRDRQFRTIVKIAKFEKSNGWFYDGCPECLKKSKTGVTIVACGGCKSTDIKAVPIYKIEAVVTDGNEKATAIFFTKAAEQLVGYPIQHVRKLEFTVKNRLPKIIMNLEHSKWELQVGVNTKSLNHRSLIFNVNRVIRRMSADAPTPLAAIHPQKTVLLLKSAPEQSSPSQEIPCFGKGSSASATPNHSYCQPPAATTQPPVVYNSTPLKRPPATYQRRTHLATPPAREGKHPMIAENARDAKIREAATKKKGKRIMTVEECRLAEKKAKAGPPSKRKLILGGTNLQPQPHNPFSESLMQPLPNSSSDQEVNNYSFYAPERKENRDAMAMAKPLQMGSYTIIPRDYGSMQPISNFTKNPNTFTEICLPKPNYNIHSAESGNMSVQPLNACVAESVGNSKTSYEKLVDKERKEIEDILAQEDWDNLLEAGYTPADIKEAELYLKNPEEENELYHTPVEEIQNSSPKTPSG